MSTWVSTTPLFANSSLDGLAIGALMTGTCALAITAERHAWARRARSARAGTGAAGRAGKPAGYRSRHRLGDPVPVTEPATGTEFPDPHLSDRAQARPHRPEARRLPRHAAPPVGFGGRLTGLGTRVTGLHATRALVGGAHG